MSLDPDIRRKLAALTAQRSFSDGAMDLGASGDAVSFAAAVQAIDNTMLPRNLVFSVGPASVTLSVSGRRLRALVDVTGGIPVPEGLLGKLLTATQADDVRAVGAVMQRLVSMEGNLRLARVAASSSGGAADAGVAVSVLCKSWGVDLDAKPPSDIERFCLALGKDLRAMGVIKDGEMNTGLGKENLVAELKQLWAGNVAEFDPTLSAFGISERKNVTVTLEGLLSGGETLCFVKLDKVMIFAAVSPASLGRISAAWRSLGR